MTYTQLMDLVIERFKAPISLLEVEDNNSRLIKGLPITYLLRYISQGEIQGEEGFKVTEISECIIKIETSNKVFVLEQDSNDNVLNFDIG